MTLRSSFLEPLRCAERTLAERVRDLERRLADGGDAETWRDYVATVTTYLAVLNRLHPLMTPEQLSDKAANQAERRLRGTTQDRE
jgi:hypothetical protein